jgi:hypothetical protein
MTDLHFRILLLCAASAVFGMSMGMLLERVLSH